MEAVGRSEVLGLGENVSGVSWSSIAAGAVVASALTLALLALGSGLGLSSISPWSDSGVSATTFKVGAGIYLILVAVMSSAVGGYLAARLRTKWAGIHTNESFFRDTAHGLIAWAFATVLSASLLGAAATHVVGGVASGVAPAAAQGAASVNPSQVFVDRLFRNENATAPSSQNENASSKEAARAEVLRLWTSDFKDHNGLTSNNRTYVARVVSAQTGLSQADAEKRVDEVVNDAKDAADKARKEAAKLAFFMTAALLFGAFAASLAAVEGGQLRDGAWNGRVITKRAW